jgi:hypothetical protein
MKRIFGHEVRRAAIFAAAALALVPLIALTASATQVAASQTAITAPPLAQERVEARPEDGQKWDTIIFTTDNWQNNPAEVRLVSWFQSNDRLKAFASQTRVHYYTPSRWEYGTFRHAVGDQFPCCIVQQPDGKRAFKASGDNIPKTADALASAISKDVANSVRTVPRVAHAQVDDTPTANRLPHPFRPRPNPNPNPPCVGPNCPVNPAPGVPPAVAPAGPPVVPDTVNVHPVDDGGGNEPESQSWGPLALFMAMGGVCALVYLFKRAS